MTLRAAIHQVSLVFLFAVVPAISFAQWAPGGIPVPGGYIGSRQSVVPDGQGGVLIGWISEQAYSTNEQDVFAQHLTAAGTLAPGCPITGIQVCATRATEWFTDIASDGFGGAFLSWFDPRNPGPGWTPCAQRITPSGGVASGWPLGGEAVAAVGSSTDGPRIAPDGAGGAFVVWTDNRNRTDYDLYAQHLTSTGGVAPGWPATGLPLAAYPGDQVSYTPIYNDGSGGMYACWTDGRPGAVGEYMQHLLGDGTPAPGWPTGGLRVAHGRGVDSFVPDDVGGFYLGLALSSRVYQADSTYYLLRVTATGQTAPGWAESGTLVCNADFIRNNPHVAADASGRVYMAWDDYRGHTATHMYATEMLPDGTFAPGWPVNGAPVSTYPVWQTTDDILADGTGGVFIAGEYDASNNYYGFMQHLSGTGAPAPGWNAAGVMLNPQPDQHGARMAPDGTGGAIVVWENGWVYNVYAQRFPGDGATGTLLALVSADARPDHVSLLWQGDAASSVTATVERRTQTLDWQVIATAAVDGTDRLRYDDRDVVAGTRYGYRLSYVLDGTQHMTAESWVDVPAATQLSLAGLRPNPSTGANLTVSFSLPDAMPARLELIDVSGRLFAMREVGSLGAGSHVEVIQAASRVHAGLYWLRLTQGNRALVARAVVTE